MIRISCYDKSGESIGALHQWDMNVRIVVHGLSDIDSEKLKFHLTNMKQDEAFVITPTKTQSGLLAILPNELLITPDVIQLYVYEIDDDDEGRTIAAARISVEPRKKPNDYAYIPTVSVKKIVDGLTFIDGKLYLTSNGEIVGDGVSISGESQIYSANQTQAISHGFVAENIIATAEEVS